VAALIASLAIVAAIAAHRRATRWGLLLLSALLIVGAVAALRHFPREIWGPRAWISLKSRGHFFIMSLRMLATRPWFGIGVGRYYVRSADFMPTALSGR